MFIIEDNLKCSLLNESNDK